MSGPEDRAGEPVLEPPSRRWVGGFEVGQRLGQGASATVYRARQVSLQRDVALKILDPLVARNPEAARRFEAEGRRVAVLDHPAILPVFEAGNDDGVRFLAMRLVEGHTLADELRGGALTAERILQIAAPVAGALDHAHQREIVHRDVKPGNILIEGDRVWLSDFGIAATTQEVGAYTTGALGTAEYMAPEQIQPRPGGIDGRADLYAFGCTLYECLVGHPPYQAGELLALLHAQATAPVPSTGNVALDRFFLRALAKDPERRQASGAELVGDLRAALGGALVDVPPPPAPPDAVPGGPAVAAGHRPRWGRAVAGPLVLAGAIGSLLLVANHHGGTSTAALRPGLTGPVVVVDPVGVRWRLPAHWRVEGVNPSSDHSATVTALADGGGRVAEITVEFNRSETGDALARRAGPDQCPTEPLPISFGNLTGAYCLLHGPDWNAPHPDVGFDAYYANTKGQSWVILVAAARVSTTELTAFRNSFTFEA